MSKTIAINAGSSSLKWQLYQMPEETVIAKGIVERIGLKDSIFTIKYGEGEKFETVVDIDDHEIAVRMLLDHLIELHILGSYDEITGVGHRVVAGGEYFKDSTIITDDVLEKIEELAELAPLHNPANAMGIKAFKHILPNIISVAVFDTSFHTTMPKVNYMYSIPKEYYEKYAARKYGAHGTSHRYVSERAIQFLNKPAEETKIITCHIGNGASITAVKGGKSVDTSMGFTPLAGVTMGTRSGDIDASLLPYLMRKEGIEDVNEMIDILNKKSGILGLSGISSDMRDVQKAAASHNEDAELTIELYADRIRKYIAQYISVMNGVDAIVFTAGVGENAAYVREAVLKPMTWFGIKLNPTVNNLIHGEEAEITSPDSQVKVFVIPTDEEVMIARDVQRIGAKLN
ncbi:acetate/propionate family kinase [Enterococcus sp. JM9B]|uniref:acetate/propionate family kinase n=1 Tax=Enterococcus sp. JM9B TaxID=1857216 RepID=UPI001374DA28|nr:acetate kinase [Enterococcus sp. JM9B]KAF1301611.1 acetate kinase [Enterococcus sp. JM9B]